MPEPFFLSRDRPEPAFTSGTDWLPRMLLEPTMARGGLFDGAWWPRSHDVEAELPDLITALNAHLGRVVRVALDPAAWDHIPRSLTVDGQAVRVGCFAAGAGTISVTRGLQDHFLYLVVPPGFSEGSAAAAMRSAAETGNNTPAQELLVFGGGGIVPRHDRTFRFHHGGPAGSGGAT